MRMPDGDACCRETVQGRRPALSLFSLAGSRGRPAGQLPRKLPRETDFAMKRPEGDGFRLISITLAGSRGTPMGELPRGCPRETLLAARPPKGEGFCLPISPSDASVAGGEESCRDSLRRRNPLPQERPRATPLACSGLPRALSRHPSWIAATKPTKGDGFCHETARG